MPVMKSRIKQITHTPKICAAVVATWMGINIFAVKSIHYINTIGELLVTYGLSAFSIRKQTF